MSGIAADSLAPKQVGQLMFPLAQKYVDKVILVEDDEILNAFAVVAPTDKLAAALHDRCDGVIDRVLPAFPRTLSKDTVTAVLHELRQ